MGGEMLNKIKPSPFCEICVKAILNLITIYMLIGGLALGAPQTSNFNDKGYSCSDYSKTCADSGAKEIGGIRVTAQELGFADNCWEWRYTRQCNYPSSNDCSNYADCYLVQNNECLFYDCYNNCVNRKKEFSCGAEEDTYSESNHLNKSYNAKRDGTQLVCKGIPCIDGNCIDKSYEVDQDMMESISQLHALSQGKNINQEFRLFEGRALHCSKKPADYCNCCRLDPKGWGEFLGAKCNDEENILHDMRLRNLCVQVKGKKIIKKNGIITAIKRYYCCFNNIIEKVVQVEGRKQLVIDFGNADTPQCQGLTEDQLKQIDFSKIDYSEIAAEMQKKLVVPDAASMSDVQSRVSASFEQSASQYEADKNLEPHAVDQSDCGVNPKAKEVLQNE